MPPTKQSAASAPPSLPAGSAGTIAANNSNKNKISINTSALSDQQLQDQVLNIVADEAIVLSAADFFAEQEHADKRTEIKKRNPSGNGNNSASPRSGPAADADAALAQQKKKSDLVDFASFFLLNVPDEIPGDSDDDDEQNGDIINTNDGARKSSGAIVVDKHNTIFPIAASSSSASSHDNKQQLDGNSSSTSRAPTELVLGKGRAKTNDDNDSDSSWEEEPTLNRIGDVPLEWYKDSDHVGYDVEGRRILRPKQSALDSLISQTDNPEALRTIIDPTTGEKKVLSNADLQLLFNLQRNRAPNPEYADHMYDDYDDVPETVFDPLNHPLARGGAPSKKTFVPTEADTKLLARLVKRQMKEDEEEEEGKKKKKKEKKDDDDEEKKAELYNLWEGELELDNKQRFKMRHAIPKTKVPPPGTYESYRPPAEYLPSERAKQRFRKLRAIDRKEHFLPQRFETLRHVPFYKNTVQDRYQRCLDLSMYPRRQRTRLLVDPDKLLPDLPEPSDLKPYPERLAFIYKGHTATVRSISVSNNGEYIATGCDDHMVRIYEVHNGRLVKRYEVNGPVMQLLFCPNPALNILAVAVEYQVLFFVPPFMACDAVNEHSTKFIKAPQLLTAAQQSKAAAEELEAAGAAAAPRGRGVTQTARDTDETAAISGANANTNRDLDDDAEKQIRAEFVDTTPAERAAGIVVKVVLHARVRRMAFHAKGDYMSLLCPKDHVKYRQTIMLQLSTRKVFCPFRKFSEIVTDCKFHPTEPYFFLATTNSIRCYNLMAHRLVKRFKAPGGLTTCISVHPEGENFIVGDSTAHTQWFDTEYSEKAYRRLKSHKGVVNEVAFHPNTGAYPLFATAASDGQVHVFHGMVYDDLNKNALIVPVKILKHARPVYSLAWHPTLPWLFTTTDDGTVCCWCEL